MIIEDGHEIGIHGYTHENPLAMTREQETEVLDKTFDIIKRMSGKAPVGYMAPWWELSPNTVELLLARGIQYDGSLMEDDYHPYYLRVGDKWTKIDYKKKASEWMVPWKAGKEIDLVELPASWLLDDAPPTMFVKAFPNSHGWVTGRALEEIWKDQFDWVYRNHDYAIYPLCIHPDSAGKPHVLMLLGASHRPHDGAFRRAHGDVRRDGGGFPQALSVRFGQGSWRKKRALISRGPIWLAQ